jgi:hypothetical protein
MFVPCGAGSWGNKSLLWNVIAERSISIGIRDDMCGTVLGAIRTAGFVWYCKFSGSLWCCGAVVNVVCVVRCLPLLANAPILLQSLLFIWGGKRHAIDVMVWCGRWSWLNKTFGMLFVEYGLGFGNWDWNWDWNFVSSRRYIWMKVKRIWKYN